MNEFRSTYYPQLYIHNIKFSIKSSKLGIFRLSDERLYRLELMKYLSNIGYSSKQISEFFNYNKIKTIRSNRNYTPTDIWLGINKYNKRLKRYTKDSVNLISEKIQIIFKSYWLGQNK